MSQSTMGRIQTVARKRQRNWGCGDCDPQVTYDTTSELYDLWAERRKERAQRRHGSRHMILARARVERELERLAAVPG